MSAGILIYTCTVSVRKKNILGARRGDHRQTAFRLLLKIDRQADNEGAEIQRKL